jgi:acyl-CoA thioesterase I
VNRTVVWLLVALALVGTTACNRSEPEPDAVGDDDGPPFTYVAVGASESVGVGAARPQDEAWTNVFFKTALRRSARFVNLGVSGSTVRQALDAQVPRAEAADPALVTVWLNVNDIVRFVRVADYERDLGELVRRLRRGGETQVLLANTPPIEELPVVRACLPEPPPGVRCPLPIRLPGAGPVVSLVAEFNAAINRVAQQHGAVVVDLHAAGTKAVTDGRHARLVAADGFHPSTEGHAAIAEVFAATARAATTTRGFLASKERVQ